MPIRTNRGRGAVYRRIWGWPIRSTKHLLITVIFLAVLIFSIGVVAPKIFGGTPSANGPGAGQAGPSASSSNVPNSGASSSTLPPVNRLTSPLLAPTSAPPSPEALNIVKAWATAWVNHPDGITKEAWLEGLKPYTTEEFLPQLSTVELANIPATQITGEPVAANSFTSSIEATVATDGPKLTITAVLTDVGWRVSQYDQAS